MTAAPVEFYEAAMGEGSLAMLPLEDSPWLPVYTEVAGWLLGNEPLVDLGCGTGRFAVACCEAGHDGGYTGIDFSPSVVIEAVGYITSVAPDYPVDELYVSDLRDWHPPDERSSSTTYVCLEVLEHLDEDVRLVERIPGGHRFLFSVPNYGSAAHVRRFPSPESVWARYSGLLHFRRWSLVEVSDSNAIHVLDATRRVDSWK